MKRAQFSRVLSALALVAACAGLSPEKAASQSSPATEKFFLGADISALDAPRVGRYGRVPLPPYQEGGQPSDELTILMHHGWTAFRIRVFVSPVRDAPDNSLQNAIPLAKKIKAAGAVLILDLHFSDTWADPQHQEIPVAWRGLSFGALAKQWEVYARDTIRTLREAGAMPDIVAVGNETTRGTAWPLAQIQIPGSNQYNPPQPFDEAKQWKHLTRLLKAGIRGVKEGAGNAPPRIAIHIDQGGHWSVTEWYFDHLNAAHVPYDIIGESFYPPWGHGTLANLSDNMARCAQKYPGKPFLVMETGYGRARVPNDQDMLWPVTPQGRLQFMVDLVNTVRKAPNGLGVLYWEPEWDLWNEDGTPGPSVFTLDYLTILAGSPASHAPAAARR